MFVTYKIINNLTGEFYIGSHKTDNIDDNYMGSGRLIRKSIEQYGIENHSKEILGIFETRKESIDFEHMLIKEAKAQKENLLNMNNGGQSFDYINQNLSFDRVAFGKMATHNHTKDLNEKEYLKNPNLCKYCNTALSYNRRWNQFCNNSCAAKYNNKLRANNLFYRKKLFKCKYCGKEDIVINSSNKKFCNNTCSSRYFAALRKPSSLRKQLLNDKSIIIERHKTESLRKIAETYNCSANYIKEIIKNMIN